MGLSAPLPPTADTPPAPSKAPRWDLPARVAATVASAGVLALISPPIGLSWLHWFVFLPMFWVLREGHPRANALYGWLFGTTAIVIVFRWIAQTVMLFSNVGAPLAYAALALFAGIWVGLPYILLWSLVHPLRKRLGDAWMVAFPASLVLIEYLSQYLILFPYQQGVSQYRAPFVWQIASVTGVWGVSFLLMFVNAALAEGIYRSREGRPPPIRWVAAAVAMLSSAVLYGAWRYERVEAALREAPVVEIAQLQSGMTMQERLQTSSRKTFAEWVDRTERVPPGSVDLVVWPEGASPCSLNQERCASVFSDLAREGQFEMLVGSGARDRVPGREADTGLVAFNSVYHVGKDGEVTGRYDKMVPLPFGEYMPLADTPFAFLVSWIEGPGNFHAGEQAVVLQGEELRFATPICYEAILGATCALFEEPDLFVTVTNDAWFGPTAEQSQHAMLSAARAIELGTPLVRSGYTGVSMVVEPHGVIHSETEPFTDVERIIGVRVEQFPTLYSRWGDWFVLVCALGLAAMLVVAPWVRPQRRL